MPSVSGQSHRICIQVQSLGEIVKIVIRKTGSIIEVLCVEVCPYRVRLGVSCPSGVPPL